MNVQTPMKLPASFRRTDRPRQQGYGLIEVLVAIVLLSVGMLSMLMAQTKSMSYERNAELRGVAMQLSAALADRMRANAGAADSYVHQVAYRPDSNIDAARHDCAQVECDAGQMAAFDLAEMRRIIRNNLPGGDFYVEKLATGRLNIWALWLQPVSTATPGAGEDAQISFSGDCPRGIGNPTVRPQCLPLGVML